MEKCLVHINSMHVFGIMISQDNMLESIQANHRFFNVVFLNEISRGCKHDHHL
jgi:hypothetical protein